MARQLGNDRVRERAVQQALVTRNTGRLRNAMQKEIVRAMRKIGTQRAQGGSADEAVVTHRQNLERVLESSHVNVANLFADRLEEMLGKSLKNEERERRIREWIARAKGISASAVAQTTIDDAMQIIDNAIDEGLSASDIAKRIRELAPSIAARRAARIARTEVHAAAQAGQMASARASGVTMEKEWVSSQDMRVRSGVWDHRQADGERVPVDDMFMRTGQPMEHPGDFSGSPGNVINCRCATIFHVVE